ncbi:hypothetical protein [Neobacillus cucumis]|nr:hypothetical protein [Neobacillus cucumis]
MNGGRKQILKWAKKKRQIGVLRLKYWLNVKNRHVKINIGLIGDF